MTIHPKSEDRSTDVHDGTDAYEALRYVRPFFAMDTPTGDAPNAVDCLAVIDAALAKARLIAAAPDLYEALNALRPNIEEEIHDLAADMQEGGGMHAERFNQLNRAIAALAKARGQ